MTLFKQKYIINCLSSNLSSIKGILRRYSTKWDLYSAVCVERVPIISRDLSDVENKFHDLQTTIEFESSLKCDHEMRKEKERIIAEKIKKGQMNDSDDMDQATQNTAQDFEDASNDELSKFKLASRNSQINKTTDLKRKLDETLLLVVEDEVGNKNKWILPQVKREDGETMRQAAERALNKITDNKLEVTYFGNAPWGFYKYKYPKNIQESEKSVGAKIFFFKALYKSGNLDQKKKFQWLNQEEIAKCLHPEYFKSVDQFLWRESPNISSNK